MSYEHHFTLVIEEDMQASLEAVFPGGPVIGSVEDVLRDNFINSKSILVGVHRMRRDSAISGAMRWPWSQEFPITQPKLRDA